MDAKEIQELINFIANSGLDEVNIETGEFKIKVKRHSATQVISAQPTLVSAPVQAVSAVQATTSAEEKPLVATPKTETKNYTPIKSPMIGTFYRSPAPDKPMLVNVGDEIKQGQVVCIIEAMKLFNEIESEVSGRVVKVLVDNANPVEYDQELFLVEPI
jgi:acetyl-CoA carboxylase biotin carboxyl carrier protein